MRTGAILRADWLVPSRPRFYEYDGLRGLAFVVRWAERYRRTLARRSIAVALAELERRLGAEGYRPARRWHGEQETQLAALTRAGGWGPVTRFPLLDALSGTPAERALVDAEWRKVRAALERLDQDGLLA